MTTPIIWAAFLVAVLSQSLLIAAVMHESDQASLMTGALQLAAGKVSPFHAEFYNYDKQFVAYWFTAFLIRLAPAVDPILLANLGAFAFYWGSLAALIWRRPARTYLQSAMWIAVIFAPAALQHSAFLASNFIAAGWIFLAAAMWSPACVGWRLGAILLFGFAVGSRLDVLALLPLLAWLLLPMGSAWRWIRRWELWAIAGIGVFAAVLGRTILSVPHGGAYDLFFIPKIFAVYVLFGLGAVGLGLMWWSGRLCCIAASRSHWWPRGFYLAGAAALAPILLFYSLQLFSTRHWTTTIAAFAVIIASRRAVVIFSTNRPLSAVAAVLIALIAILPLGVGLYLPTPSNPSLRLGAGSEFPTTDGVLTMGGYIPRMLAIRKAGFLHDHNQAVWTVARSTMFTANEAGQAPFLFTPMFTYYELAATMQGFEALKLDSDAEAFYVDSRSLRRFSPLLGSGSGFSGSELLRTRSTRPVSENIGGIEMVMVEKGEPNQAALEVVDLADQFGGDDFRVWDPGQQIDWDRWTGHRVILQIREPALIDDLVLQSFGVEFERSDLTNLLYASIPGSMTENPGFREWFGSLNKDQAAVAIGVLPAYMSVSNL